MANNKFIIIVAVLFFSSLAFPIYMIFSPSKFGETHIQYYSILEESIANIKSNMDEITKDSSWKELKKMVSASEKQLEIYNMLLADIKNCYDSETNSQELSLLKFKNKRSISDKKLKEILDKESCLKNFTKYEDLEFSEDKLKLEKIKGQVSIIIDYQEKEQTDNFTALLHEETDMIKKISNLTNWLKIEFNSYQD